MGKSIAELERMLQSERNKNEGLKEIKELGNKRSQLVRAIKAERAKRSKLGKLISGTRKFASSASRGISVATRNYEKSQKTNRTPKKRVQQFDPFSIID